MRPRTSAATFVVLALAIAAQAMAAPPPPAASIVEADAEQGNWYRDDIFRTNILEAHRLKIAGDELEAFRRLYDAVGSERSGEQKLYDELQLRTCEDGLDSTCIFSNSELTVPQKPIPATLEELISARGQSDDYRPLRFGWEKLRPEGNEKVAVWFAQAAIPDPFQCNAGYCFQLVGISNGGLGGEVSEMLTSQSDIRLADGTRLKPILALCEVKVIGTVAGPPEHCVAVLAETGGQTFAVSVVARDKRPPPPHAVPVSETSLEMDLLRIDTRDAPNDWLAKQIESALSRPLLKLTAVARNLMWVEANSGFRDSPVLTGYRETAGFKFVIRSAPVGLIVSVRPQLRVTRQNNPHDLRRANFAEISQYQSLLRSQIVEWLGPACARLPSGCDFSP